MILSHRHYSSPHSSAEHPRPPNSRPRHCCSSSCKDHFRFIFTFTHGIILGFTHAVLFLYGFCGWSECMRSSRIDLWAAVVPLRYNVFRCGFFTFWDGVLHPHTQEIALLDLTQQAGSHLATIIHDFLQEVISCSRTMWQSM